jgi:hypothetical protein
MARDDFRRGGNVAPLRSQVFDVLAYKGTQSGKKQQYERTEYERLFVEVQAVGIVDQYLFLHSRIKGVLAKKIHQLTVVRHDPDVRMGPVRTP